MKKSNQAIKYSQAAKRAKSKKSSKKISRSRRGSNRMEMVSFDSDEVSPKSFEVSKSDSSHESNNNQDGDGDDDNNANGGDGADGAYHIISHDSESN